MLLACCKTNQWKALLVAFVAQKATAVTLKRLNESKKTIFNRVSWVNKVTELRLQWHACREQHCYGIIDQPSFDSNIISTNKQPMECAGDTDGSILLLVLEPDYAHPQNLMFKSR